VQLNLSQLHGEIQVCLKGGQIAVDIRPFITFETKRLLRAMTRGGKLSFREGLARLPNLIFPLSFHTGNEGI
jgi:hypothetical protein